MDRPDVFPTMTRDLRNRSAELDWPPEFEPEQADWFSHNEAFVNAPVSRVWDELTATPNWPTWYPLCDAFEIDEGARYLHSTAHFRWTTFGLTIEGDVVLFEPMRRISWNGYAAGTDPTFFHQWLLTPVEGGCHAVYDEAGNGTVALAMRNADEADMHRGHELLLAGLRWASERPKALSD
ncbi:SRPBCC family protein [Streptomyces sp. NPDC102441]|uniref:SRPBCC family protein n=1 Tax=Streptomyces sp. NPDC102441 TaxID=3366176 RepID=UPI0037F530E0